MPPVNPFSSVVEANALYPWSHEPSIFCKCSACHSFRQEKILAKCARFALALSIMTGDDQLDWPTPECELPPASTSLTPTSFVRPTAARKALAHAG